MGFATENMLYNYKDILVYKEKKAEEQKVVLIYQYDFSKIYVIWRKNKSIFLNLSFMLNDTPKKHPILH